MSKYFVSRQIVWPEGTPAVEIAPFLDAAGPGMLVAYFQNAGEGREFDDPREAVEAAIRVRDLWWASKASHLKGWEKIEITYAGGGALGIAGEEIGADDELRAWAEKRYEAILKCAECGEPIYQEKWYASEIFGDDAFACCSERCAQKHDERSHEE